MTRIFLLIFALPFLHVSACMGILWWIATHPWGVGEWAFHFVFIAVALGWMIVGLSICYGSGWQSGRRWLWHYRFAIFFSILIACSIVAEFAYIAVMRHAGFSEYAAIRAGGGMAFLVIVLPCAILVTIDRFMGRRSRLSHGERQIRDLVRETYMGNITGEQIVRQGRDAMFSVKLKNEKVEELRINISSLWRKHKEGASLVALKTAMRFDDLTPSADPPPPAGPPADRVE
jgi:hypothetical protein